ncbi:hypothetical protein AB0I55_29245 [Actinocatenispora sera]|uniref:hypothetical protein n=1 Tax=Actinocatenispora sera TaxID=390989 RepID=UPI00340DD36B
MTTPTPAPARPGPLTAAWAGLRARWRALRGAAADADRADRAAGASRRVVVGQTVCELGGFAAAVGAGFSAGVTVGLVVLSAVLLLVGNVSWRR